MTPERRQDFEAEWPELAGRLKRMLARRGVPDSRRDDVVQETAVRLYGCWENVDRSRPAWPLTRTIAINHMRDQARKKIKEVPSEMPEVAHDYNVENAGLARLELGQVRAAMDEMSPEARASLLVEVGGVGIWNARASAAEKMQRMRARRKLRTMLNRVPAALSLRFARIADFGEWILGGRAGLAGGLPCFACAALGLSALVPASVQGSDFATEMLQPHPSVVEVSRDTRFVEGDAVSGVGLAVTQADELRGAAQAPSQSGASASAGKSKAKGSSSSSGDDGLVPQPPPLPTSGYTPEASSALSSGSGSPPGGGGGGGGEAPGLPPVPGPNESTPLQVVGETLEALEPVL